MYNYIPHPSNCRVSSNVLRMLMREGVAGYGIYWMLLEMLRDAPDFRMFFFPESFAYAMHCNDVDMVTRVCKDYGLFEFDQEDNISSSWLHEAMGEYSDKKAKLQEAGRRGAAKRWASAHREDGQAIATPSMEDGQAIAYNVTKSNVIQRNDTLPFEGNAEDWRSIVAMESPKVDAEYLGVLSDTAPEGHAPGYVAQVCMHFGMTEAVCNFICERSDNASTSHPLYNKFCALVRRIQQEKWAPKHPANFFLSKLME